MEYSGLHDILPASILEHVSKLARAIGLQISKLCPHSVAILSTRRMTSHEQCECDQCVVALEILRFDGDFVKFTDTMSDEEAERLVKMEQNAVLAKFDDLPPSPMKNFLHGKINADKGQFIRAKDAFMKAFFFGYVDGLFQHGKMCAEQAKTTGDTMQEQHKFEACVAFLLVMTFNPIAKLYLLRLLLPDLNITLGSIKNQHKEIADSAIQTWVLENQKEITKRLQVLINKQAEAVCPHLWREIPSDDLIPNTGDPENPFTLFCEWCGIDKV